jgi:hypothetical protein
VPLRCEPLLLPVLPPPVLPCCLSVQLPLTCCSTKRPLHGTQQQPCISTGQHVVERLVLNRGTQNASGAFTSACMQPHAYMMAAVPRAGLHMAMTSQLVTSL